MTVTIQPFMYPLLGALSLHGYGIMICLGVLLYSFFLTRDPFVKQFLTNDTLATFVSRGIIAGITGGRVVHVLVSFTSYPTFFSLFAFWQGGFSMLGTVAALALYIPLALYLQKLPVLKLLDRAVLYAPLLHGMGRLGCLWAGCCFGISTHSSWGVMYQGITAGAPCGVTLHPTQVYSALWFFVLFAVLYYSFYNRSYTTYDHTPARFYPTDGSAVMLYGVGIASERFCIDFLRDDRIMMTWNYCSYLSWYQLLALLVMSAIIFSVLIQRYYVSHIKRAIV